MVTTNSINNKNGRIFDPVSRWEVKGSFGCPFCFSGTEDTEVSVDWFPNAGEDERSE